MKSFDTFMLQEQELDTHQVQVQEDDMKGMSVKSGHKRSVDQGAGLTKKGAAAYRRKNPGSKLGTAVTTPPSKLDPDSKAAGRRKSFCARSRGWDGERGKAARRRWNCGYEMEGENFLDEAGRLATLAKTGLDAAKGVAGEVGGSVSSALGNVADGADKGSTIGKAARSAMGKIGGKLGAIAGKTSGLGTALGVGAGIGQAYKNTDRAPAVSGRGAGRSTFNPNSSPGAKLDPK
jgi:hypothetical protein